MCLRSIVLPVDRGQVPEDRPISGGLDIDAVDRVDPEHAPVLLAVARCSDGAADAVTDAEAEAANLARADVDVVRARQQAVAAHESEALVDDVEDPGGVGVAGPLCLALEDALDEIVLALLGAGLELEVASDLAELVDAHLAEVGDVEIVPLAGGLELEILLVFGDGGARRHLGSATWPTVA
jgi:predicted naringenin-chalcone synthase